MPFEKPRPLFLHGLSGPYAARVASNSPLRGGDIADPCRWCVAWHSGSRGPCSGRLNQPASLPRLMQQPARSNSCFLVLRALTQSVWPCFCKVQLGGFWGLRMLKNIQASCRQADRTGSAMWRDVGSGWQANGTAASVAVSTGARHGLSHSCWHGLPNRNNYRTIWDTGSDQDSSTLFIFNHETKAMRA